MQYRDEMAPSTFTFTFTFIFFSSVVWSIRGHMAVSSFCCILTIPPHHQGKPVRGKIHVGR